jgi:hypothetical protein
LEITRNNRKIARGKITFPNGITYEGQFNDQNPPQPHGQGTWRRSNGRIFYKGECQDGIVHGQGKMTYLDGSSVEGTWDNGRITSGKITYMNGITYEGQIKDNDPLQPDGQGTLRGPDGRIYYEGEFQDGIMYWHSKMISLDGTEYVGKWINGQIHGEAILTTWNDEEITEDGRTYRYGRQKKGIFENGTLIRTYEETPVINIVFPNDEGTYTGQYIRKDDNTPQPNGQGTLRLSDGNTLTGTWKDGFFYVEVENPNEYEFSFDINSLLQ